MFHFQIKYYHRLRQTFIFSQTLIYSSFQSGSRRIWRSFPARLGTSLEYTPDGTQGTMHTHIHTLFHNQVEDITYSPPTGRFWDSRRKTENPDETNRFQFFFTSQRLLVFVKCHRLPLLDIYSFSFTLFFAFDCYLQICSVLHLQQTLRLQICRFFVIKSVINLYTGDAVADGHPSRTVGASLRIYFIHMLLCFFFSTHAAIQPSISFTPAPEELEAHGESSPASALSTHTTCVDAAVLLFRLSPTRTHILPESAHV